MSEIYYFRNAADTIRVSIFQAPGETRGVYNLLVIAPQRVQTLAGVSGDYAYGIKQARSFAMQMAGEPLEACESSPPLDIKDMKRRLKTVRKQLRLFRAGIKKLEAK